MVFVITDLLGCRHREALECSRHTDAAARALPTPQLATAAAPGRVRLAPLQHPRAGIPRPRRAVVCTYVLCEFGALAAVRRPAAPLANARGGASRGRSVAQLDQCVSLKLVAHAYIVAMPGPRGLMSIMHEPAPIPCAALRQRARRGAIGCCAAVPLCPQHCLRPAPPPLHARLARGARWLAGGRQPLWGGLRSLRKWPRVINNCHMLRPYRPEHACPLEPSWMTASPTHTRGRP
ncbi:MAG: hypothetical protein J3K34DRAFT_22891 [Monoraphidium minutum]|nr:MAG: hypothetical protein J3K34DRAFT_22891 [Monoraphidium minutum]